MEQIKYDHPLYPRYSAAMAVVGDELYIFGGKGNKYGKQELSTHYYLGLYAINLKTKQSRIIWEKKDDNKETIMASSMYFEPSDSTFYAVSTDKGGTLWKISMKSPVYTEVSKPINNSLDYQDCDFNLYFSPTHRKLFLVLDKILNNRTHDVKIYSINMPLVNETVESAVCHRNPGDTGLRCLVILPLKKQTTGYKITCNKRESFQTGCGLKRQF